ncbi:MAG: hypothetical protein ACO1SX_16465 [Actinomycetota bacterium]
MPPGMCESCEKLYLFEFEEAATSSAACPRCGRALTRRTIRAMNDLPRFPFELVRNAPAPAISNSPRSEGGAASPELCVR